jgi:hypothetical protein
MDIWVQLNGLICYLKGMIEAHEVGPSSRHNFFLADGTLKKIMTCQSARLPKQNHFAGIWAWTRIRLNAGTQQKDLDQAQTRAWVLLDSLPLEQHLEELSVQLALVINAGSDTLGLIRGPGWQCAYPLKSPQCRTQLGLSKSPYRNRTRELQWFARTLFPRHDGTSLQGLPKLCHVFALTLTM